MRVRRPVRARERKLWEIDACMEFKRHGWHIESLTRKFVRLGTSCWAYRVFATMISHLMTLLM
jgi:hypothetical protein